MPSVDTGIIDTLLHPGFGLLKPHLDSAGPYTGNQTLTTWSSTLGPIYTPQPVANTFGVILTAASSMLPGWGRDLGWTDPLGGGEDYWHVRLAQVVIQHQLLSGLWVSTQIVEMHTWPLMIMWDVALPGRIGLLTAPGLDIDLYYLLIN